MHHYLHLLTFLLFFWQINIASAKPRIVCYYANWSINWLGKGAFEPRYFDPHLCTHLIYAFGSFNNDSIGPSNYELDITGRGYATFTDLKNYNKDLKTLIGVGGWTAGSVDFSPLVADPQRRKRFVTTSITFLRQHNFDGLDLDWQHPTLKTGARPEDTENYVALVRDLRNEFQRESAKSGKPQLLLTMTVASSVVTISDGYDIQNLIRYVDWMSILGYDYYTSQSPAIQHHSPLYSIPEDMENDPNLTVNFTVDFFLKQVEETDIGKLQLGIPAYGRSYTLEDPELTEIGSISAGPGIMGNSTGEAGYLAYFEICEMLATDNEWIVDRPYPDAIGPYAHKDNQWVGYDDPDMVRTKAKFAAQNKLGGIVFWTLAQDDFLGTCTGKPYPLIEAGKEAFVAALRVNYATTRKPITTQARQITPIYIMTEPSSTTTRITKPQIYTERPDIVTRNAFTRSRVAENPLMGSTRSGRDRPEPPKTDRVNQYLPVPNLPSSLGGENINLPNPEETYKIIKDLIRLIKAAGGIIELEKQLEFFKKTGTTPTLTFDHALNIAKDSSSTTTSSPTEIPIRPEEPDPEPEEPVPKPKEQSWRPMLKFAPVDKDRPSPNIQETSTQLSEHPQSNLLTSLNLRLDNSYSLELKLFQMKK